MSVVNSDLLDEGLQSVMGKDRCQNEWKPMVAPKPCVEQKSTDASWEPVKEHHWMDNLKSCVKSVFLFGGLSCLVFYWQQAGLMDSSVAVPTMCVCTALAGVGVGRNIR